MTRQLGPLPISAGVVAGLVAAFDPDSIGHKWMLWVALGLFGVLVLLSILYGNMRPYRVLRDISEVDPPKPGVTELEWYGTMLELESSIYGTRRKKWNERWLPRRIETLQEGFERERTGLVLVQTLFAVVIVLLVLSRVA